MSSTTTPVIGLFKPIPGTAEPFRVADLNENMDLLDAAYGTIAPKLQESESATLAALAAADDATAAATASTAALAEFETDSAAALAAIDTDAVISTILTEGYSLDIDGGTA
jgi:hypothetical protein